MGWPQAQPCLQAPSGCGEVGACTVSICLFCVHPAGVSPKSPSLFIYLKITRSYRNSAKTRVPFTWLLLMTLLYAPQEVESIEERVG